VAQTIPYVFERLDPETMRARAQELFQRLQSRRSCRFFSSDPVPLDVVRTAIHTASQAPSGAHKQPWTFVLVTSPDLKRQIRIAAEAEERETYEHRMSAEWRAALAPLGTGWEKPFLETAPALVVIFRQDWERTADGGRRKNYYVQESVGIAAGYLIAALHHAGLATLTHTPSPMGFLSEILERPANERPFLLVPVGWPSPDCVVPVLERKPLAQILVER
jgi:nitroreductase